MCVVEAGLPQQACDQRRSPLRVFNQDPVEIRNVQEGVGEASELSFLHWSAVGRCDDMDGRERVGPWWWAGVDILGAHHLHYVLIGGAELFRVTGLVS